MLRLPGACPEDFELGGFLNGRGEPETRRNSKRHSVALLFSYNLI
jgi:hypothetical protein